MTQIQHQHQHQRLITFTMKLTVALTLLASAQSFTSHRATSTSRGVSSFTGVQPLLAFYNGDNLEAALEREVS